MALLLSACGGTSSALATGSGSPTAPSKQAKMICSAEAQNEVAGALGDSLVHPATASWASPLYSCRMGFAEGEIVLSVQQLADGAATTAYFDDLAGRLGKRSVIGGLGQGAFDTADDSVVVRKDAKVLRVDVSGMPPRLGNPSINRSEAATRIAIVIMGCWTGD